MRRRLGSPLLVGAVAVGLTLTACASGASDEAAPDLEARLVVAEPAQPPNLDPMVSTATATSSVAVNVFETLLTTDENLEIQPMLAERFEVSDDGASYTFHLRDGVKFHDGTSLDSADVVASMERWSRLSGPGQSYFTGASWTAVDELTVRLDLETPSFGVPLALSGSREQFAAVMPSEVIEAASDEPVTDIIGTGPFVFVDWVSDQRLTLDRFDDYQPAEGARSGRAGDRTAEVAGIDIKFVPDASTRILGLQTGEYDVVSEVPYDSATQVLDDDSLRAGSYPVTLLNLYYNKAQGLFADVEARRAVDTALDREPIMTAAVADPQFFTITPSVMLEAQRGQWDSDAGADRFNLADPAKAKELLAEAGYTGGPLRMITTRDYVEAYNSAIVVIEQLKAIGMDVSLETYDWPTFTEVRDDPSAWDLAIIPNTAKADPGSLVFTRKDFAGSTNSPELDAILAEYRASATLEEAQSHYDEFQGWFYDYLPVSKLGDADTIFATTDRVEVTTTDDGIVWWSTSVSE